MTTMEAATATAAIDNEGPVYRARTVTQPALDEGDRAWLREYVARVGETEAQREIGLSRNTIGRALAGLGLYAGSRGMIRTARERITK